MKLMLLLQSLSSFSGMLILFAYYVPALIALLNTASGLNIFAVNVSCRVAFLITELKRSLTSSSSIFLNSDLTVWAVSATWNASCVYLCCFVLLNNLYFPYVTLFTFSNATFAILMT